jgi:DNA-binding PucR family transcriptional regulator
LAISSLIPQPAARSGHRRPARPSGLAGLRATIIAWCEAGFGLVAAASALHIHRNTLVYRLGKIERITGRPLREHRATLTLYLACLADQLDDAD